jgi:hypothetical protein
MSTQHLPGKNCRNPADDTPGNPDAKLHLPVKSEKNAHTAAAYQSQRDKEQATWHHSGK